MSTSQSGVPSGPRLVLVHGIGRTLDSERSRQAWIGALARGAEAAGHDDFAERLRAEDGIDVVYGTYRDLFFTPNAQGGGDGPNTEDEAELLREFFLAVIDELLEAAETVEAVDAACQLTDDDLRELRHARAQLESDGAPQGVGSIGRRVLNAAGALVDCPPFARVKQWSAAKLLVSDFNQVARYLNRREPDAAGHSLDERIRARFGQALGGGTAVVVAHSLGSVVAFEGLHDARDGQRVPLLVTIGSPLAMRGVVWPRIRPRPPRTPECVGRWLNFWDRDDPIVARPVIERRFAANAAGVEPVSRRVRSDGIWTHSAVKYLEQPAVAAPIAEVLTGLADPGRSSPAVTTA